MSAHGDVTSVKCKYSVANDTLSTVDAKPLRASWQDTLSQISVFVNQGWGSDRMC